MASSMAAKAGAGKADLRSNQFFYPMDQSTGPEQREADRRHNEDDRPVLFDRFKEPLLH